MEIPVVAVANSVGVSETSVSPTPALVATPKLGYQGFKFDAKFVFNKAQATALSKNPTMTPETLRKCGDQAVANQYQRYADHCKEHGKVPISLEWTFALPTTARAPKAFKPHGGNPASKNALRERTVAPATIAVAEQMPQLSGGGEQSPKPTAVAQAPTTVMLPPTQLSWDTILKVMVIFGFTGFMLVILKMLLH